jgi:hypothetical protein
MNERVRIQGQGENNYKTWVYYLNDKEKKALSDTYQLGWLMKDILRVEQMLNAADANIQRYEKKYGSASTTDAL